MSDRWRHLRRPRCLTSRLVDKTIQLRYEKTLLTIGIAAGKFTYLGVISVLIACYLYCWNLKASSIRREVSSRLQLMKHKISSTLVSLNRLCILRRMGWIRPYVALFNIANTFLATKITLWALVIQWYGQDDCAFRGMRVHSGKSDGRYEWQVSGDELIVVKGKLEDSAARHLPTQHSSHWDETPDVVPP